MLHFLLEPDALREARPVLRGGGGSDAVSLPDEQLEPELSEANCQVVVSGHSHKPKSEMQDGVLYLNPGSAGPRRFKLPVTLMRLYVTGSDIQSELVTLI